MKKYKMTMYAPDQSKFWFEVTAESKEDAERTALRRIIVINTEEVKED